ncbi:SusC/RagA family TonB-linked outer membrane protein [Sphingobacterium phlebotomi]|uniref:SusC/RagA family TonB-linked outer membrane protein n=1 Tax=Sphingobacterium phlebotomi TaxID=2605433 RepID=A0A5D4H377_9SPHI|nr:SusC/RagA family TonB-linked outer membrane protein [Sphingobacterium phlebotomi]TYR34703.1 SusC/RagA family TonB-linked outer membrane protein [Sphingobacterium phlebotomi]
MRLTLIILITTLLQVRATALAQHITIHKKDVTLKYALKEVRRQSGFNLFYDGKIITDKQKIDVDIDHVTINQALEVILRNTGLKYEMKGSNIAITKSQTRPSKPIILGEMAQIVITGLVLDESRKPLVDATVQVKHGEKVTKTNADGRFYLNDIRDGETLVISFVGYGNREISAAKDLGAIQLMPLDKTVDEVQVIGYGSESKRFSVGAVSSVSAETIERQPVTNPLSALQGQVAGLAVTSSNGVPGSTVMLQVRGQNTLGTTLQAKPYDQPLFIIDGVPFAPQNVNINLLNNLATAQSYNGGISQPTGLSPFNSINPKDIESISILKDAAATSIYGSQGANGVVLITTKKGQAGETKLDVSVNTQFNSAAKPVRFLNTQQYLQLRREAYTADGLSPSDDPGDYNGFAPDLMLYDQDKYTDWAAIIAGKMTNNTDVHATLSGGSPSTTFLISGGYTQSNYNYPGNFSDKRMTFHSALNNTSSDQRFKLGLVADYGYDRNTSARYGGAQSMVLPPNLPDLIDDSGALVWNYKGIPLNVDNFYGSLMRPVYLQNYNFNGSLHLSYILLPGLTLGTNAGYSRNNSIERSENPARSQDPTFAEASAAFGDNVNQSINIEPQLNYEFYTGKGEWTALVGGTYRKMSNDAYQVEGYGYANDNFLGSIIGASTTYPSERKNLFKYIAGFARLKYIHDHKYILEVSGRRDGSSNFGPGRQFGNFGSAGGGWIFSEEAAIKKNLPLLSYGKLSASYGTTGGDASKAYSYQALYQNISGVLPFQNVRPTYAYNLYNPNFSWSTKRSLNVAMDIGLYGNALNLNATYYRNRQGDQLVDMPLPAQTGFPVVFGNLDALVQNQGWEFTIESTNVKKENFSWNSTFNITFNRNKLLDFPDLASSSYASKYIIGQPTSIIMGYRYKGVNPETGLYEFYDKDGNATHTPKAGNANTGGDQVPIGHMDVKYMGGLANNLSYKNWGLFIFCQFSSSYSPNYLAALYSTDYPGGPTNQPSEILGRYWKNPGDHSLLQRLGSSYASGSLYTIPPFTQSEAVYGDNTYLRIKTVSLSYTFPEKLLQKIGVSTGNIYMNGQNLLTFTNYKVGDPEQPGTFTALPLQRIVALGVNLKF